MNAGVPSAADLERQLKAVRDEIPAEQAKAAAGKAAGQAIQQSEAMRKLLAGVAAMPYMGDLVKALEAGQVTPRLMQLLEQAADLNNQLHQAQAMASAAAGQAASQAAAAAQGFADQVPAATPSCPHAQQIAQQVGQNIKNNPLRQAYENEVADLAKQADAMLAAGQSEEQVARAMHEARRQLGVKYKDLTPEPLREYIYEVNQKRYGDKLGPTYDDLVKKGKSNAEIIKSACKPNPDVDKLLAGFGDWLKQQDPAKLAAWASQLQ